MNNIIVIFKLIINIYIIFSQKLMGFSQSRVPANDPFLNGNNRQQSLLNSIYMSNTSVMPQFGDENHEGVVSVEINPPKVKKTKTYKNPILLKRSSIKLVN